MGSNHTQVIRILCIRTLALLAAILAAGACGILRTAIIPPPAAPMVDGLIAAAAPGINLIPQTMPRVVDPLDPTAGSPALVITSAGARLPDQQFDAATVAALRAFVQRGGRILLLGYAAALAERLLLDVTIPESAPFRWGFDARTSQGRARLGVQVIREDAASLFAGIKPMSGLAEAFFLTGGEPCFVPLCCYRSAPPTSGEVLANLVCERDGERDPVTDPVLVRWRLGSGAVLSLGIEPQLNGADALLAQNGTTFMQNAMRWLLAGQSTQTLPAWVLPEPLPPPLKSVLHRQAPYMPLLAHWGFVASPMSGAKPRTPGNVLDEVLMQSWQAGADVLAFDLVASDGASLLPWSERDPLVRPKSYRAAVDTFAWRPEALALLAREAHSRGVIVHGVLDPQPVTDRSTERLATLRFYARELADRRRLQAGAFDGFAVRDWFADREALGMAMLQDFQPAARFVLVGEQAMTAAVGVKALDARDGQPAGLYASGISDAFRNGFPGDLVPVGLLDARARRPLQGGGGGSGGDWIAVQAADFVRARRFSGGAMLWSAQDPASLDAGTQAYVEGVSMEPLVAAVAARCSTIGVDGFRDAQRQLLPRMQQGFGAELLVPAETVLLQNNHFRLCGSGGALQFDPSGLGRFRVGEPVLLGKEFLRTRMTGGRPVVDELRCTELDLLEGGRKPAGGYTRTWRVEKFAKAPSQLAFGVADAWPQRVEFTLDAGIGCFDLRLALRAMVGRGVVAVGMDDGVRAYLPFDTDRLSIEKVLPLQIAVSGKRTLWLEVQDGGSVAIDLVHLNRTGDVAAEADVMVPAGSYAVVRECSASSYHEEAVELSTIADFPGLLLRTECKSAARNLQFERSFGFVTHGTLRACAAGDNPQSLRHPFVLGSSDPSLPDVAVVPLLLGRYERFELRADGLVLKGFPEAGAGNRIGFCFLPREESLAALDALPSVLQNIAQPMSLDLRVNSHAELTSDNQITMPRLVQIERRSAMPIMVCEGGFWTWRPTQQLSAGRELLRIWQQPSDHVQLLTGQELFTATRPGPGSLRNVALQDRLPASVTVHVTSTNPLALPSVVMGAAFDAVFLDGKPWAFFDGHTITLPLRAGTFVVKTQNLFAAATPRVLSCSVGLDVCRYEALTRDMLLLPQEDLARPATLPHTVLISGPVPSRIIGGELVDDSELRHASRNDRAMAAGGGVLIRFRSGPLRVHYGD